VFTPCLALQNHFVRHNTPHPKELKARHAKVFGKGSKDVDGHVIPHNPEKKTEVNHIASSPIRHVTCCLATRSVKPIGNGCKKHTNCLNIPLYILLVF